MGVWRSERDDTVQAVNMPCRSLVYKHKRAKPEVSSIKVIEKSLEELQASTLSSITVRQYLAVIVVRYFLVPHASRFLCEVLSPDLALRYCRYYS